MKSFLPFILFVIVYPERALCSGWGVDFSAYPVDFSTDQKRAQKIRTNHLGHKLPRVVYMFVLKQTWTALEIPPTPSGNIFITFTHDKVTDPYTKASVVKPELFRAEMEHSRALVFFTKAQPSDLIRNYETLFKKPCIRLKIDTTKLAGTVALSCSHDFFGDSDRPFLYADMLVAGGIPLTAISVLPFDEHQPIEEIDWDAE